MACEICIMCSVSLLLKIHLFCIFRQNYALAVFEIPCMAYFCPSNHQLC